MPLLSNEYAAKIQGGLSKYDWLFKAGRASGPISDSNCRQRLERKHPEILAAAAGVCWISRKHGWLLFWDLSFQRREPADGEYHCWYFSPSANMLNQLLFSNNVFECLLSAPHGMTLGYRKDGTEYSPILKKGPSEGMLRLIHLQQSEILKYIEPRINDINIERFDIKTAKRRTEHAVRRLMAYPTRTEAQFFGQFLFSDDITESSSLSLTGDEKALRRNYLFIPRIWRKLTKFSEKEANYELFWPYGTAAVLDGRMKRVWYFLNIFMWDYLKWIIHENRK